MNRIVEQALQIWGLTGAAYRLVAARENSVYEISSGQNRVALRLHRQGYRKDSELVSELCWMAAAADAGISVPAPIPAKDGAVLQHIVGVQVDVLTWLAGKTMTVCMPELTRDGHEMLFFVLGREMARLHEASDNWIRPPDFDRVHWDQDGLLGGNPHWDRFWENPDLTRSDRALFEEFRDVASAKLARIGASLEYGLIHADLGPDNVLVDDEKVRLIDFDDGGFGYRIFEIATSLHKHTDHKDFPAFRNSLINGYHSVRALDLAELDLFLAIRAATYAGWNISRMNEPGGAERNARIIEISRRLAARYLRQA